MRDRGVVPREDASAGGSSLELMTADFGRDGGAKSLPEVGVPIMDIGRVRDLGLNAMSLEG